MMHRNLDSRLSGSNLPFALLICGSGSESPPSLLTLYYSQRRNERLSFVSLLYWPPERGAERCVGNSFGRFSFMTGGTSAYLAGADSDPPVVNKVPMVRIWTTPASLPRPKDRPRLLLLVINPWQCKGFTSPRTIYLPRQPQRQGDGDGRLSFCVLL